MKLTFACLALVFLACEFNPALGQLNLSVHAGFTVSSMTPPLAKSEQLLEGHLYSYSKPLTGYYAGLFTSLKLNKFLSVLLDCTYSKNGYQTFYEFFGGSGSPGISHYLNYTHINFIEPQFIFEYGLPLGSGKMSLGAGFNLSIPISGQLQKQYNYRIELYGPSRDTTTYSNDISKAISLGIVGMLRYEFNIGMFLEVLYNYQINAQPFINVGRSQSNPALNLSVFELGTGFAFQFKKKGG